MLVLRQIDKGGRVSTETQKYLWRKAKELVRKIGEGFLLPLQNILECYLFLQAAAAWSADIARRRFFFFARTFAQNKFSE